MSVRRLVRRLHFAWAILWCAVVSLVMILPGWAHYLFDPTTRRFWRWMRAWARIVLTGCSFRVDTHGDAYEGTAVIVANHQGMLDIPALLLGIGRPFVFVARAELRRRPIIGTVLTHSRCVYIDRDAAGPGLIEASQRVAEGDAVLFFPEGTRSYGESVRHFHSGAFGLAMRAGVPVLPVAIDGAPKVINERQYTARPGTVRVRVGDPLSAEPDETSAAFAARTRDEILRMLGTPAVAVEGPLAA